MPQKLYVKKRQTDQCIVFPSCLAQERYKQMHQYIVCFYDALCEEDKDRVISVLGFCHALC